MKTAGCGTPARTPVGRESCFRANHDLGAGCPLMGPARLARETECEMESFGQSITEAGRRSRLGGECRRSHSSETKCAGSGPCGPTNFMGHVAPKTADDLKSSRCRLTAVLSASWRSAAVVGTGLSRTLARSALIPARPIRRRRRRHRAGCRSWRAACASRRSGGLIRLRPEVAGRPHR